MKTPRSSIALAGVALFAGLALAACGGSSGHHPTAASIVPKGKVTSKLPPTAVAHFASDQAVTGAVSSAHVGGRVVASIPFNPAHDGFAFQNYGFIAGTELGPGAMRQLFGDRVCATAPSDACTLTPLAQNWAAQITAAMAGGHCYGFSMAALRFFDHNLDPNTFGAGTVYALAFSPALEQTIAADWATQALSDVATQTRAYTPTGIVHALEGYLAHPHGRYYSLSLYNGQPAGNGGEGHAITPIGIANQGGGQYQVLVYDNNYPGTTRAVEINTNNDTWRYLVAVNPNASQLVWSGQGQTNPLELVPVSTAEHTHPCPFCGSAGATRSASATISLGGNPVAHSHLLITTGRGRRLGFVRGRFVNQIPGARVIQPALNAVWKTSAEPIYVLPADQKLSVTLAGGDPTGQDTASISVSGPGFGTSVTNLVPTTRSSTELTLLPGGANLAVKQTGTTATPTLELATGSGHRGSLVQLTPKLGSGGKLSVSLPKSGRGVHVSTSGLAGRQVALTLSDVGPQGTKSRNSSITIGSGQSKTVATPTPILLG